MSVSDLGHVSLNAPNSGLDVEDLSGAWDSLENDAVATDAPHDGEEAASSVVGTYTFQACGRDVTLTVDPRQCCGGHVWISGLCLARLLQDVELFPVGFFSGKRIFELGAGTGVTGAVAGILGADCVLTDQLAMLPVLRQNMLNLFGETPRMTVEEYNWGTDASRFLPIDYVLAADVLYWESAFEPLAASFSALTENGHTQILLAYRPRWKRDKKFLQRLLKKFDVTQYDARHYGGGREAVDGSDKVTIYRLGKKTGRGQQAVVPLAAANDDDDDANE